MNTPDRRLGHATQTTVFPSVSLGRINKLARGGKTVIKNERLEGQTDKNRTDEQLIDLKMNNWQMTG